MCKKTYLLIILYICGFSSVTTTFAQKDKNPNVLLIVTDEHNFRTLGCYRDQLTPDQALLWGPEAFVETPNIDELAASGVIFNRMYGSAPVCTASRGSMFTGMYPHTLGVPNNSNNPGDGKYLKADVTTIADVFSAAGYATGYVGKWHLAESKGHHAEYWQPHPVGHPEDSYGFQYNKYMFHGGHDKFKGIDADGNPYYASKSPKQIGLDKYGQPLYEDERSKQVKFTTDFLSDRAIEFIEDKKDEPFFCVVSIPDTHSPDVVREPYSSMYKDMEITLPKTFYNAQKVKDDATVPEWQKPAKTDNEQKTIEGVRQYFGMVKCIDDNVGRMIQTLRKEGVLDNTIIIFASDHGDLLGEHARLNKGTVHEASDKVPFVIAHGLNNKRPIIPRGKVINKAANTTDWMPTLLSLTGLECPEVAGRDLSPLIVSETPKDWNDVTFVRLSFKAAITERYKLHLKTKEEPWLLDIVADPDEEINFINDPSYLPIAKKLAKDLKKYMIEQDDPNKSITTKLDEIIAR